MNESYKDHHVKLMHSNGTTAYETFSAILPSSLITFITVILDSLLWTLITKERKWQFVMEFIVLVVPVVLGMTVLSKYLRSILVTLVVIVVNLVLCIYNVAPSKSQVTCDRFNSSFLTNARSTINILSVIAILAVDFNVFPRCFAKTESFGYSLMDVGVGLFMYSNGIVSPETKGRLDSIKKSVKSSLPLFALGMARFVFVKQTDYNVPVSEYGVHWNFFITLAMTKIVSAFVLNVIKIQNILVAAVFMIASHETLLQAGLQKFTLTNVERNGFVAANREGIVSSLGYVSIYLFSVHFGHCLRTLNQSKYSKTVLTFILYSFLTLVASLLLQSSFGISRKLANSSYCFWILFIGIFMTGLYYIFQKLLEIIYKDKLKGIYCPIIFEAINYNGLIFFLTGNILTGLINMTVNTLTISALPSLAIIILYMFINCSVVTFLYYKQCKLKF